MDPDATVKAPRVSRAIFVTSKSRDRPELPLRPALTLCPTMIRQTNTSQIYHLSFSIHVLCDTNNFYFSIKQMKLFPTQHYSVTFKMLFLNTDYSTRFLYHRILLKLKYKKDINFLFKNGQIEFLSHIMFFLIQNFNERK